MRKAVYIILSIFVLVSCILVLTETQPNGSVEILAIRESRALLINSRDERVEIMLFISDSRTFLTEPKSILSLKIADENQDLELALGDILTGEPVEYKEKTYVPHCFQLGFAEVFPTAALMQFHEAKLVIAYTNDIEIAIEIGDLSLCFMELSGAAYLDFNRLYGETNSENGKERLAGIVIGIDIHAIGPLLIKHIDTFIPGMTVDIAGAHALVANASTAEEMITVSENGIYLNESGLYRFPVKYDEGVWSVTRFPVLLQYAYLGREYAFAIDDFLFFRKAHFAEVGDEDVFSHIHHYS